MWPINYFRKAAERRKQFNAYRDEFLAILGLLAKTAGEAGREAGRSEITPEEAQLIAQKGYFFATDEFREKHPEVSDDMMDRIVIAASKKKLPK